MTTTSERALADVEALHGAAVDAASPMELVVASDRSVARLRAALELARARAPLSDVDRRAAASLAWAVERCLEGAGGPGTAQEPSSKRRSQNAAPRRRGPTTAE